MITSYLLYYYLHTGMKNATHPNQNLIAASPALPNHQLPHNKQSLKTISNLNLANTGNYNQLVNSTTKKLANTHLIRGNKYHTLNSVPHAKALYDFSSKESG